MSFDLNNYETYESSIGKLKISCTRPVNIVRNREQTLHRQEQTICMASKERDRIPKAWESETFEQTVHRQERTRMCMATTTITCAFHCIVVDDVTKQIGFHGNASPSCKQRPQIKTALTLFLPTRCQIFLITRQSWYCSNALRTQDVELTGNWVW